MIRLRSRHSAYYNISRNRMLCSNWKVILPMKRSCLFSTNGTRPFPMHGTESISNTNKHQDSTDNLKQFRVYKARSLPISAPLRDRTQEFLGSFMSKGFARANQIIFDEDYQNQYIDSLHNRPTTTTTTTTTIKTNSSFVSEEEITQIASDFSRVVEASFEFETQGLITVKRLWDAIFSSSLKDDFFDKLRRKILIDRANLLRLLLKTGEYNFYDLEVLPAIHKFFSPSEMTALDNELQVIQMKRLADSRMVFNVQNVQSYLMNPKFETADKRALIKNLVSTLFCSDNKNNESILLSVTSFLNFTEIIESNEWFTDINMTEYDEIFRLFGVPPQVTIGFEEFLEDIVLLVERKDKVLNPLDLAYAMRACLQFDENKIYELYMQNKDLHQEESQEEVFLSLCVQHNDWRALQERFENMYGHGNLPETVHYGITMYALEYLNADNELERLYEQILGRNMNMNAAIFIARMRARVKHNDQAGLNQLIDEYIALIRKDKAEASGLAQVFPYIFKLYMKHQDFTSILSTLHTYLEMEQKHNLLIVSGTLLANLSQYFAANCALKELNELWSLTTTVFNKQSPEYFYGLIRSYSILGQFSKAEEISFFAHQQSLVPFSNLQIYAAQMQNYQDWRMSDPTVPEMRYINMKTKFIMAKALNIDYSMFQLQAKGNQLLAATMEELQYEAKKVARGRGANTLKSMELKAFVLSAKDQQVHHMNQDELLYLPILKSCFVYENYQPLRAMKIYQKMVKKNVLLTAASYKYFIRAVRVFDKKFDMSFKNTTELLKGLFISYGIYKKKTNPKLGLDFYQDYLLISDIVVLYVDAVGKDEGRRTLKKFISTCNEKFEGKLPTDLKFKIDAAVRMEIELTTNKAEYRTLLESDFENYTNMLDAYIESFAAGSKIVIASSLNKAIGDVIMEKVDHYSDYGEFDRAIQQQVIDTLLKGVTLPVHSYNRILRFLLKSSPENIKPVLQILEKFVIERNLTQLELYKQKKFCYKLCLRYLGESYKDSLIEKNYKILSDYYGVKSLQRVREELKEVDMSNFLQSSSGRLFNIKLSPYASRSMSQINFIDYFNPLKEIVPGLRLLGIESKLVVKLINEHFPNRSALESLEKEFPKVVEYYRSNLSYYKRLEDFENTVYYLDSSEGTKIRKAKNVLTKLLLTQNSARIFIAMDENQKGVEEIDKLTKLT
ncbi:hypothetical protein KGF56_000060 [Candida oxycetoniae]|uniref:Mitochondrial group I intron splicing factor CCM1 n=1 Tax=Candida oxycetoniae TaxID=497107 RepID=A0AAI9T204_9ASCO|nr:uncharacterized protein KGF56_000060 [Candida oxycetoniae]KAI3407158.2 hypothetical protein KGF56_000060 [Candida oxycetoniae]